MNKSIVLTILVLLSLSIVALAASSEISLTITSSDPTQNDTTGDLYLESINVDSGVDVYRFNWYVNGQSFAELNLPFEDSDSTAQFDLADSTGSEEDSTIEYNFGTATFSDGTGYDGNGSLYFDGASQMDIDDSTDINVGIHGSKTVEFWFKATSDFSSSDKQVLYEEGGIARGFNLYLSNGRLYLGGWNNDSSESNWNGTFINTPVNQDQYYHVAAVLDNAGSSVEADKLKLYLDGSEVASGEASQLWTHYGDINLGAKTTTRFHDEAESYGAGSYFTGHIDELQIYSEALVARQIAKHASGDYAFIAAEMLSEFETWYLVAYPLSVSTSLDYNSNDIEVLPVNTAPTASDDSFIVAATNTVTLNVLANDVDAEGDSLSVSSVGTASQGTVSLESDGSVQYTAPADFVGTDTFTYEMQGVRGGDDFATVTVTIVASDTTAPTVTSNEPTTDVIDRDVTIRVQAQDDVAIDTVRLVVEDSSFSAVIDDFMLAEASDDYYYYTIAASTLSAGIYTVNVTANDTSVDLSGPNTAELSWSVELLDGAATTYAFVVDPTVSSVTTSSATVSVESSLPNSQLTVYYATSETDLNTTPNSVQVNLTGFLGDVELSGLSSSTGYFYYVNATSYDAREIQSTISSFTTSAAPVETTNNGGVGSSSSGNRFTQCSNGQDDDGDGLVDLADPDCSSRNDNLERGSTGVTTATQNQATASSNSNSGLTTAGAVTNPDAVEQTEDALSNGLTGAVVSDGTQGVSSAAARTTIIVLVALVVAGLLAWFVYSKYFATAAKQE